MRMQRMLSIIALSFLIFSLSGCETQTTVITQVIRDVPKPKLSVEQIRQLRSDVLKQQGVRMVHEKNRIRFIVPSHQLFNKDSANLKDDYKPALKNLAEFLKTYEITSIKIEAYRKGFGDSHHQQALADRQAQVIANYLWSQKVDVRVLWAKGYLSRSMDVNEGSVVVNARVNS